jgi:hypothetical protein
MHRTDYRSVAVVQKGVTEDLVVELKHLGAIVVRLVRRLVGDGRLAFRPHQLPGQREASYINAALRIHKILHVVDLAIQLQFGNCLRSTWARQQAALERLLDHKSLLWELATRRICTIEAHNLFEDLIGNDALQNRELNDAFMCRNLCIEMTFPSNPDVGSMRQRPQRHLSSLGVITGRKSIEKMRGYDTTDTAFHILRHGRAFSLSSLVQGFDWGAPQTE